MTWQMICPVWSENFPGHTFGGYLKVPRRFLHSKAEHVMVTLRISNTFTNSKGVS